MYVMLLRRGAHPVRFSYFGDTTLGDKGWLLGHRELRTAMIDPHVLQQGPLSVHSRADRL